MDTSYTNCPATEITNGGRAWKPGAIARLPWLGLGALLASVLSFTAAIGILIASDGQPLSSWRYQPTVYLSIASTITNITLHFALSEGVAIAWWRKAVKPKTQLGDLHRYWDFGNSLWAATTCGRRFNLIALACIVTALAPINGPLLQRASTVTIATVTSPDLLSLQVTPILSSSTAYLSGRGYSPSLIIQDFTAVVQNYYNGGDVRLNDTGCSSSGVCRARVKGAGFAVNCSSYTVPFSVEPTVLANGSYDPASDPSLINGTYAFMSFFGWNAYSPGNISLNVQYKASGDCAGELIVQNCSLRRAVVEYPVIVNGNKSTISLDPHSSMFDDVVDSVLTAMPDENRQGPSILGGYWFALNNKFASTSHLRFVGAVGYELLTTGSTAPQYAVLDSILQTADPFNNGMCNLTFRNPTNDLLQEARKFMFQTAVATANASDIQRVSSSQRATRAVYQSHYEFLAIAVGVTAIAILLVTITFHGYWHLGRRTTMSPIELAKAFNAPLMRNEDSNAEVKELVKRVGNMGVRYGAVAVEDGIEHEEAAKGYSAITSIQFSAQYSDPKMRLEVTDESIVGAPERGSRFLG